MVVVKPPLPLTHMRQLTTIMEHSQIPLELIEQSLDRMSGEWDTPSVSTVSRTEHRDASVSLQMTADTATLTRELTVTAETADITDAVISPLTEMEGDGTPTPPPVRQYSYLNEAKT